MAPKIELNEAFVQALSIIEDSTDHLLVVGRAGVGKSTLLDYVKRSTAKNVAILAPTGVAAVNIGGQTIHSFFGFRPDVTIEKAIATAKRFLKQNKATIFQRLTTILVDEISMVRADLFDCMDHFLKTVRGNRSTAFGGVQVVAFGDLYQLPPIVKENEKAIFEEKYGGPYFFQSAAFASIMPHIVELEKVYRQHDAVFIELLNRIRNNTVTDADLKVLNQRVDIHFAPKEGLYVHLTPFNATADAINTRYLSQLKNGTTTYMAVSKGDFGKEAYPASPELTLKVGAQVMLLNNDSGGRWINGSMGQIVKLNPETVVVELESGRTEEVAPFEWEMYRYSYDEETKSIETKTIGTYKQIPIRLAWAITIHKSQGKTFDHVVIDLGRGTFASGQAYVALSRCRTLEGIVLKTPFEKRHIRADARVVEFLTQYQYAISESRIPFDKKMAMIVEAIEERQPLHITYLKHTDEKSRRVIMPLEAGDMEFGGRPFVGLRAICDDKRDERIFRVDRILDIAVATKQEGGFGW